MNIQELESNHLHIVKNDDFSDIGWKDEAHTKLSIQFAIEMLEESITDTSYFEVDSFCANKIEELKKYL